MVTIKEIANAVGVSSGTVSRVLNYDPTLSVSATKRQAIIEAAEALNYETPRNRNRGNGSSHAGGPSLSRLVLVHFLESTEELADPYYVGVRLGIENRCKDMGTEIAKIYHGEQLPDQILLQGASGVIAIGQHKQNEIDWLQNNCRNIVFADFKPRRNDLDCVYSDLNESTHMLLDDIAALGYSRIGFIGISGPADGLSIPRYGTRGQAYVDWHKRRGLFSPELLMLGDVADTGQNLRLEAGYSLAKHVLQQGTRPDIVVVANDNMAIGAYRAFQEAGLSIPDDIAVVSFNDIPVAQFLNPPLSSVRIRGEHIGEAAVELLVERLAGRDYTKRVIIPTRMIWRESCRHP
ncbi:LacI family DNA-binding transcriptional regulator [Neorhizobium sp. JUb45]|uniref:LacI family DNA-binding transcriptional regulator n=1 Tax=unclassified Neorhizobium TaxID=2629175 RepID=UPI00104D182D|nr:LacI family DNA-binding transcriptional regulator [Neorhizobium sp. JUb45]TCQ99943.1 LacI family transcriptional regulator [Neorhizobium sp. JUb45]